MEFEGKGVSDSSGGYILSIVSTHDSRVELQWWASTGMRRSHKVLIQVHGSVSGAKKFVDDCERVGKGRSKDGSLERKQWEELVATLEYALEHEN